MLIKTSCSWGTSTYISFLSARREVMWLRERDEEDRGVRL